MMKIVKKPEKPLRARIALIKNWKANNWFTARCEK